MGVGYWFWANWHSFEVGVRPEFDQFVEQIGESEWTERIFRGSSWAGAWDDDPSLRAWERQHGLRTMELLFRTNDPPDRLVRSLLASDPFVRESVQQLASLDRRTTLRFTPVWGGTGRSSEATLSLQELASSSLVAMHLMITLEAAIAPLGLESKSPRLAVSSGSVQLSVDGGLFAAGISLLVACSEGLLATPLAIPAGIALGAVGAFDLVQNWRKRAAEIESIRAEAAERQANRRKLIAETERLESELKSLRRQVGWAEPTTEELAETEARRPHDFEERLRRLERGDTDLSERHSVLPAASRKIDETRIRRLSQQWNLPCWVACHWLNRSIPTFIELSKLSEMRIHVMTSEDDVAR